MKQLTKEITSVAIFFFEICDNFGKLINGGLINGSSNFPKKINGAPQSTDKQSMEECAWKKQVIKLSSFLISFSKTEKNVI